MYVCGVNELQMSVGGSRSVFCRDGLKYFCMFSFQLRDHSHKEAGITLLGYPFLKLWAGIEV